MQSAEFVRRLGELAPANAGSMPDGLGYRGLRVGPRDPGNGEQIEVGAGVVRITRNDGGIRHCADAGRALEHWLIETGRGRIDTALLKMALTEAARTLR